MPIESPKYRQILQTLLEHKVDFIVIGGVSAVLHGAPIITYDLDIVHSRATENVSRLLTALQKLDAVFRDLANRRIVPTASHVSGPGQCLLNTRSGPLDLLGTLHDGRGYDDLIGDTFCLTTPEGETLRVLNLASLIAIKEAAGRDKDRLVLPILRQALLEQGKQP